MSRFDLQVLGAVRLSSVLRRGMRVTCERHCSVRPIVEQSEHFLNLINTVGMFPRRGKVLTTSGSGGRRPSVPTESWSTLSPYGKVPTLIRSITFHSHRVAECSMSWESSHAAWKYGTRSQEVVEYSLTHCAKVPDDSIKFRANCKVLQDYARLCKTMQASSFS